jgi:hypothetical protein
MFSIKNTINYLQQSNQKAYYFSFLRVSLCLWILKEIFFRWPALKLLYSKESFLNLAPLNTIYIFHIPPEFLKQHYMAIVYVCVVLLVLNMLGIGRNIVSFLLLISCTILYSMNNKFTNAGDKMSLVLLFYLSFANTFAHFTLFKRKPLSVQNEKLYNLLSNLAAYSILINLCFIYFVSGLSKFQNPQWQNGSAIYYYLNYERFSVFAAGGRLVRFPAIFLYLLNYGTILLELSFPFLVWHKRSRNVVLLLCLLMHLGIYSFLMIYGMSIIFIMQYGMFYTNREVVAAAEKIKALFLKLFSFTVK